MSKAKKIARMKLAEQGEQQITQQDTPVVSAQPAEQQTNIPQQKPVIPQSQTQRTEAPLPENKPANRKSAEEKQALLTPTPIAPPEPQEKPKEEEEPRKERFSGLQAIEPDETIKYSEAIDVYEKEEEEPKEDGKKPGLMGNSKKKGGKKQKGLLDSPQTVQQSIPYTSVYSNGIIETLPGVFTKSYFLEDVNFQTVSDDDQEAIFMDYGNLLNSFGNETKAEITLFNRNIDQKKFEENTLLKMKNDGFDEYRGEYNKILLSKMNEGKNNISCEKYLTLAIEASSIDEAVATFNRLDVEISAKIKKINATETSPMSIEERLSILHDIYNADTDEPFIKKAKINGHEAKSFDLAWLKKQGITTKDVIAPPSMYFQASYFKTSEKFARTLYLDNLPTFLSTDLIPALAAVPCNSLISIHFDSMQQDKAVKLIRNQNINIDANVIEAQKKQGRKGLSPDTISSSLQKAQEEAKRLMHDVTSRNQKLFLVSMVITVFADTLEDLDNNTKMLQSAGNTFLCSFKNLQYQQELGFATSLPLALNRIYVQRLLTTETASLFIPFSSQELKQANGMYYGINAVTKNLLLFNRTNSRNANGVILGTPGAGKSFSAKREMLNVFLGTDADVYIIDPEREYTPMASLLGGEVVKIAAGSKTYINPLDMDLDYADDDDPITLKSDFIGSLCEIVIGGHYGLAPIQKSVIDRCVRLVYQPYMEHMKKLAPKGITVDKAAMPTLVDFYDMLLLQPEPEAQNIALGLELYCLGSLDAFAHKTNVKTESRFVVYDIKDIGSGMKEMGLQVCLNDIWNKIIENKKKGKKTWFYIDEFYLLTQNESSAKFLQQIWKRARKWGGVPTGITQNVEDLLISPAARGIINNCDFVLMLNQSPLDRAELSRMLNISEIQQSYITNADAGQGLIYTGKGIVPFVDKFPSGNALYRAMTTKPDEVVNK